MSRATSSTRSVIITKSLCPRISWACCASCTRMTPSSAKQFQLGREHSNCTSWAQSTVDPKLRPLWKLSFWTFCTANGELKYRSSDNNSLTRGGENMEPRTHEPAVSRREVLCASGTAAVSALVAGLLGTAQPAQAHKVGHVTTSDGVKLHYLGAGAGQTLV